MAPANACFEENRQRECLDKYAPPYLTYTQAKEIERNRGIQHLYQMKRDYELASAEAREILIAELKRDGKMPQHDWGPGKSPFGVSNNPTHRRW